MGLSKILGRTGGHGGMPPSLPQVPEFPKILDAPLRYQVVFTLMGVLKS
jgi:hypothetical protein